MQTILVANPKGGSGKTTLATNLAGWLAGRKQRVVIADFDPLRSASEWVARRPPLFPAIEAWTPHAGKKDLKEHNPHWLVLDTPAGLHGAGLRDKARSSMPEPMQADIQRIGRGEEEIYSNQTPPGRAGTLTR